MDRRPSLAWVAPAQLYPGQGPAQIAGVGLLPQKPCWQTHPGTKPSAKKCCKVPTPSCQAQCQTAMAKAHGAFWNISFQVRSLIAQNTMRYISRRS